MFELKLNWRRPWRSFLRTDNVHILRFAWGDRINKDGSQHEFGFVVGATVVHWIKWVWKTQTIDRHIIYEVQPPRTHKRKFVLGYRHANH